MAIEIGLAGLGDPRLIYETWYPSQLVSVYSFIVNKNYKDIYYKIDPKDRNKHPEVLVEKLLSEEEKKRYVKQKRAEISRNLSSLKKTVKNK